MKGRNWLSAVLVVCLTAGLVWGGSKYSPFTTSREDVFSRVKVICLVGPTVPIGVKNAERVRVVFDSLVTARLTDAGFTVLAADSSTSIVRTLADSLGGLFDSKTGAIDTTKQALVDERLRIEIRKRYQADAIARLAFWRESAELDGHSARWGGVSEKVVKGFWGSLRDYSGRVPAVSLVVRLEDMEGHELFIDGGGIRVTADLNAKFAGSKFAELDPDSIFGRDDRNANAVNVALSGLTKK